MASMTMEPEDIVNFAGESGSPVKNFTTICVALGRVHSSGLFHQTDPLSFSLPLLLIQLSLASGVILLVSLLLKPLGQPIVVRQLLGGIILGPSVLGQNRRFSDLIFPLRGFIMLDAISSFGFIFYFFLIGVQTDPWILKRIQRRAYPIGFFTVALPMVLSIASCFLVMHSIDVDQRLVMSLPMVAQAESVLALPVIAQFLAELKIINSEFGRVALSSSVVASLCSVAAITTTVLWHQEAEENLKALQVVFNSFVLGVVIVFVIRPIVLWMIESSPEGEPVKESYITTLFLAVLISGFCGQALGLHLYLGPLLLGISIPAGPPLGSALTEKLDLLTNWMFMPLYFVKTGLVTDIFAIRLSNFVIVQSICLVSAFGKFLGAFLVALCFHIPWKDSAALGLLMNAQGVLELGMFKMMKNDEVIDNESFVIMCINMMLVTGGITPIIRYLYNPSRRYAVYTRRTVMHAKPNSELRVLVCIYDEENVPTAINVLEAIHPTKRSPLSVFVLHLVELIGHANPLLIPLKLNKRPSRKTKTSEHIVNAFRRFQESKHGLITVHPYTSISPSKTMHDDVCTIALERKTSLVIIPFYKRFPASSAVEFHKKAIKITNNNILDKAPCSIAILVNQDLLNTSKPILDSWSSYRVAILFFGGPDDREALAIAARMAGHHKINLTVIRLLENGSISSDDACERRLDNEMVSEFRTAMAGNCRVIYVEEIVMDGTGTISVIRSMENHYELVIVGRHHDQTSSLLSGLTDWNDDRELGTIGDVLASAQFMGNAAILVVQQHTSIAYEGHGNRRSIRDNSPVDEEAEDMPIQMKSTR